MAILGVLRGRFALLLDFKAAYLQFFWEYDRVVAEDESYAGC
jgi:hypothetical protein